MSAIRLSRRAFLQAAGLTGIVAAVGAPVSAGPRQPEPGLVPRSSAVLPDRIGDLAAELGYDVEAIFRFVAEQVRYEPYGGVLRGPRGTLAGRAGNSADQALLLAALLDASFIRYRFATGELDDATAQAILASAEAGVDEVRQHALDAILGTVPGQPRPTPPALDAETQALADRAAASADAVVGWARDELMETIGTIESALAEASIEVAGTFSDVPERERREHVWLQVDSGTEWVDLDPSLPENPMGEALTPETATMAALPDELAHRVELAVIGERVAGGTLMEETLLRLGDRADRIAGEPIAVLNVRPEGLQAMGVSIGSALTGLRGYLPSIQVGDEAFVGHPFGFGLADEGDGALGSTFPENETTALWLEVTIAAPDRPPVTTRRALFDRVGPGVRAAGTFDPASLPRAELIDLGDGQPLDVLLAQGSHWLVVGVGMPAADDPVLRTVEDDPGRRAVFAQALHLVREAAALELTVPMGVRPFPDAPNVHAYSILMTGTGDEPVAEVSVDILHRSFGFAQVAESRSAAPPGVVAGVLAHVAERVLMGDAVPGDRPTPDLPGVSVGRILELARESGDGVRVLRGPGVPADLAYPADATVVLERALADGWVAIVPERAIEIGGRPRAGWWLVDTATGRTVDQLDDGRGAQGIEYNITLTPAQVAMEAFRRELAWKCIVGTVLAMGGIFNLALGAKAASLGDGWGGYVGGLTGATGVGAGAYLLKACLA